MSGFFFGGDCPNCGCPEAVECTIHADTFDTDLSAFTTTGSPGVAGGLLEMSAGDAVILIAEPATVDDATHQETFPLNADTDASMRLVAAYENSSNYLFGELEKDSGVGTIRVGQVVGGATEYLVDETTLEDEDAELDARSTLTLCWEPGGEIEPVEGIWLSGGIATITGVDWDTPEGAALPLALDAAVARYTFAGGGTSTSLVFQSLGAMVPPGSTIDGIKLSVGIRDGSETASQIKLAGMQLIDRTGAPVGDSYNDPAFTDFNPNFSTHTNGGPTEDWSAGLTWQDIVSDNFGFAISVENFDENERQAEVDYFEVQVWYTGPDHEPGRLTLQYLNTAAPNTLQCSVARVPWTGAGKKMGIIVDSGDWNFTEYTASYHDQPGYRGCPACTECTVLCDCCDPEFPAPQQYVVDFGLGGELEGEYTLNFVGRFVLGEPVYLSFCLWEYREVDAPDVTLITLHQRFQDCGLFLHAMQSCGDPGNYAFRLYQASVGLGDCTEEDLEMTAVIPAGDVNPGCTNLPDTVTIEPA